jgi:exopolysaccharide production protein ExoQ
MASVDDWTTAAQYDAWRDPGYERRHAVRPAARLLRFVEALALIYLLMVSSGMFGFVDVLTYGDLYKKDAESQFATFLWPIAYLVFAGLVVLTWRDVVRITRNNLWVLVFPAVVVLSVVWSRDPSATFDGAVRIGMTTLIGIHLGARFDIQDLAKAVFVVMLIAVGASVVVGLAGASYAFDGHEALRGLFHHKNTLGSRAGLLFGTSLALFIAGWRPSLALTGLAIAAAAAILSSSAASFALSGLSLVVLPIAIMLRSRWSALAYMMLLLGALLSMIAFLIVFYRINPVIEVLSALGRDLTFTGRILLWEVGLDYIQLRPLLGTGFDAFWSGHLDFRILLVMEELGNILHFHNSFLEVGVQLGALGLFAAMVTVGGYAHAALMALRLRVDPVAAWPAIIGAIVLALAMVEVEVFVQHKILHVLLVAVAIAARRQIMLQTRRADAPATGLYGASPTIQPLEAAYAHS